MNQPTSRSSKADAARSDASTAPSSRGFLASLWAGAVCWTLLAGLALWWNLAREQEAIRHLALVAARASFEKDVLFRRWVAGHGGVYAPVSESSPPNPYLTNVVERDLTTPSGRRLTLVNPAYMTRQVYELGRRTHQASGHLTSLKPIRPGNAPDGWERQALEAIEGRFFPRLTD